jgi:hypothetical protein
MRVEARALDRAEHQPFAPQQAAQLLLDLLHLSRAELSKSQGKAILKISKLWRPFLFFLGVVGHDEQISLARSGVP